MRTIIIKSNKKDIEILTELAKRLGSKVYDLDDEQFEDIVLGITMDKVKTGELVSRDKIMQKLSGK